MANNGSEFAVTFKDDLEIVFKGSMTECRRFLDEKMRELEGMPNLEFHVYDADRYCAWVKSGYLYKNYYESVATCGSGPDGVWTLWEF